MIIEEVNNPDEGTGEIDPETGEPIVKEPVDGEGAVKPEATFDIEGEKVPLAKILEWKKSGLMQDDYTKKTQTLAEQRKSLEYLITLDNYLKRNPDKAVAVRELLTGKTSASGEKFNWTEMSEEQQVKFLEEVAQAEERQIAD